MGNAGKVTNRLLEIPGRFTFPEYLGIAFIIYMIGLYWGRFINKLT